MFNNVPCLEVFDSICLNDSFLYSDPTKDYTVYEDGIMVNELKMYNESIGFGMRHSFISLTANRFLLLNPYTTKDFYYKCMIRISLKSIDRRCTPKINELTSILEYVWNNPSLDLKPNKERKIIFNPLYQGNKQSTVNKIIGGLKSNRTMNSIYSLLEYWDFDMNGKITQKKVAIELGIATVTIKRYWSEFKTYVKELNKR